MEGKGREGGGGGRGGGGRRSRPLRGRTLRRPARGRGSEGRRATGRPAAPHASSPYRRPARPPNSSPARPAKSHGPTGSSATFLPGPGSLRSRLPPPFATAPLLLGLLISCFLGGVAEGRSYEYSYGDGGATAAEAQKNWRITCYTCVNVSNNDECNRFAIDRPCPEGGDYCLTLHVMDALDRERSVLVNKRCASLDDCTGDSTGCNTAYGQTQCVSCCDQPYCNDSVPGNSTNAVFYRSAANGVVAAKWQWNVAWRVAAVLIPTLKVLTFGGPS